MPKFETGTTDGRGNLFLSNLSKESRYSALDGATCLRFD